MKKTFEKCSKCGMSFTKNGYIKVLLNCPYWTCGLKQSTTKK